MLRLNSSLLLCVFAISVLFFPHQGFTKDKDKKLNDKIREFERKIAAGKKRSKNLKNEATHLKNYLSKASRNRVAIAKKVQTLEQRLSRLELEISDFNQAEKEKRQLLDSRRIQSIYMLMALQRIARIPPEAVIVYPTGTTEIIRAAILLRSTVPKISNQAHQLREDLLALRETRKLITKRKSQLDKTRKEFKTKRTTLNLLIRRKAAQHKRAIKKGREATLRIQSLSGQARNLRELFGNLEAERKKEASTNRKNKIKKRIANYNIKKGNSTLKKMRPSPPVDLKPFALSRGSLRYPAVGRISGRYGELVRRGVVRKGLTIETRNSAQVVAPHNGKVVFAGNFRGYGKLLIIDHGEGYHTLLSGMSRIDGIMGQLLLAGEPVGIMGSVSNKANALYIELRRNGQPINPLSWLSNRKYT